MERDHADGKIAEKIECEAEMDYTSSYMKILEETLQKKQTVLQAILEACRRQETLAEQDEFDPDAFNSIMDQKEALLERLTELDEGFEKTYEGVRKELNQNRAQYTEQIRQMQELIRRVTDLGVEIRALEERNRVKLEARFAGQKKEMRQVKTSNRVASTYYKAMANPQNTDSYFMDQKK